MSRLPALGREHADALRERFTEIGYTVDGVRDCLGPLASAALHRNETTSGLRATAGGSPLETLTRLFPLQATLSSREAERALPGLVTPLRAAGFFDVDGDSVRATADLRPYADDTGDWWVAADLTPGLDGRLAPVPEDHVLGVNAAATTLAQLTICRPIGRALDLGTGCGVEVLHLSRHVENIVATDLSERALAFARITADLNGIAVDLRHGNLYDPVVNEQFDLIVSNPPFVVSPGKQHVYRDSGLPGDEISRRVVVDGASRLSAGGLLQALVNWVHRRGQDWRERAASWVAGTGCDAWLIQRETQDPAEYVELWLRDSGDVATPGYRAAYDAWLGWFEDHDVEAIGFGWVALRRADASARQVVVEDWPHAVHMPLGDTIAGHFNAAATLRGLDDAGILAARPRLADGVSQEQIGAPGAEDPSHVVLRQSYGLGRAREVGTAEAALVGVADGSLTVRQIVHALAEILDEDVAELTDEMSGAVRELVRDGYLLL